jgi:hypothetical protein
MSPHNEGRTFQSFSGKSFHAADPGPLDSMAFASAISTALREDYGDTHAAVKTIARLTGANQRSAKNWLEARNGPSGQSLIALCRHSDRVFEAVVRMSGREAVLKAKKVIDARRKLREIIAVLDELDRREPQDCRAGWPRAPWQG